IETLAKCDGERLREAGAHTPREDEPRPLEIADEQRAETGPRALGIRHPADHEHPALLDLGFPPTVAPPRLIGQVAAFGDDAFEADAGGVLEQLLTTADDVLGIANPCCFPPADESPQPRLPLFERQSIETFTIESKQIENEVDQRR